MCGEVLGKDDLHPIHCSCGGGVVLRHSSLARAVGRTAAENLEVTVRYEQRQPQLDKEIDGDEVKAIMDVCYNSVRHGSVLMDVRICSPCAGDRTKVQAASRSGPLQPSCAAPSPPSAPSRLLPRSIPSKAFDESTRPSSHN